MHVQMFRECIGVEGTEHRHWWWLSRQYMIFAQLLEQLHHRSRAGGAATLTSFHSLEGLLHPGHYYHAAAKYARKRRIAAQKSGLFVANPSVEPLSEEDSVMVRPPTFIGAPPIVTELEGLTSAAAIAEQQALLEKHLKAVERQANHCAKVIDMLKKTSDCYSKEPLPDGSAPEKDKGAAQKKRRERLQLFLSLETAEEEMAAEKWGAAKISLEAVRTCHLKECWFDTLTATIKHLRECAGKVGDAKGYVDSTMQLLSPLCSTPQAQKIELHAHLLSCLAAGADVPAIRELMQSSPNFLTSEEGALPRTLEVNCTGQRLALVSCGLAFGKQSAVVTEDVALTLKIVHFFPVEVEFVCIDVVFNDNRHNHTFRGENTPATHLEHSVHGKEVVCATPLSCAPGINNFVEIKFDVQILDKGPESMHCEQVRVHMAGENKGSTVIFIIDNKHPADTVPPTGKDASGADSPQMGTIPKHPFDPTISPGGFTPAPSRKWGEAAALGGGGGKDMPVSTVDDVDDDTSARGLAPETMMDILQPTPHVSLKLTPVSSALAGEYRRVELQVDSNDDILKEVRLSLMCKPPPPKDCADDEYYFWSGTDLSDGPVSLDELTPLKLGPNSQPSWDMQQRLLTLSDMPANESKVYTLYTRSKRPELRTVTATVSYTTGQGIQVKGEVAREIRAYTPLKAEFQFLPLFPRCGSGRNSAKDGKDGKEGDGAAESLPLLSLGEPVLMQAEVRSDCEQPLQLLVVEMLPKDGRGGEGEVITCEMKSTCGEIHLDEISLDDDEGGTGGDDEGGTGGGGRGGMGSLEPIVLRQKGDCYSACVQFLPKKTGTVAFGKINIIWAR
jgi:hypothetical protein